MRKTILIITLLYAAIGCKKADQPTNPSSEQAYDVVLVVGQSNTMAGIAFDAELDTIDARILQLGRWKSDDYELLLAQDPLQHHDQRTNTIGFAMTFARLYANQLLPLSNKMILIPCGKGATGFRGSDWNRGDELYNDALKRLRYVLDRYANARLKVILWHQGEDDEGFADYQSRLDSFISQYRMDVNSKETPFILGGMVPYWVEQDSDRIEINTIIEDGPNRMDRVGYADPLKPFLIEKPDNTFDEIHFDAQGQREMGRRYFDEYNELTK